MDDDVGRSLIPSPQTTTISTIAVESGGAKIVTAVLQTKEWLELRVVEMMPSLTLLGQTLPEASLMLSTHEQILAKLHSKQSPVEELMRQADQLITSQHTRPEVCAAMAESLALAWQDVNSLLQKRKEILQLNVKYHSNASACLESAQELKLACSSGSLPFVVSELRELLSRLSEVKRSMLQSLMSALQDGRTLLDILRQIASEGSLDSRPGYIKHSTDSSIYQVEQWLEDLHNQRRTLELSWQSRKKQLEQCLAFTLLTADLHMLEEIYADRIKGILCNMNELGDSEASAQLLLKEHRKLFPEAKDLQEQGLKILRATEQLASTGHFAGNEAINKAYQLLDTSTEYMEHLEKRAYCLQSGSTFFNRAENVLHLLEKMLAEIRSASSMDEIQLDNVVEQVADICSPVLNQGYEILENASGAKGIKAVVDELEKYKLDLCLQCTRLQELNMRTTKELNSFNEKLHKLDSWLTNSVEVFVEGKKDMGDVLAIARDFQQSQKKILIEFQAKESEIIALTTTGADILSICTEETKADIQNRVQSLHSKWKKLRQIVEKRADLAMHYVKFHSIANDLALNIEEVEQKMNKQSQEKDSNELQTHYDNVIQLNSQLINVGCNFKDDTFQVPELYLAMEQARLCVDTVCERSSNRVADLQTLWQKWEEQLAITRKTAASWALTMSDSRQTIDWVSKLESQLYPVLSDSPSTVKLLVRDVEDKRECILIEIKRAQAEVQLRISTANEILAQEPLIGQDKHLITELTNLQERLQQITTDYQVLMDMLISYFNNLAKLEHMTQCLEEFNMSIESSSLSDVEKALREHDTSYKTAQDLINFAHAESLKVINRIQTQEPTATADIDVDCVEKMLVNLRSSWERMWTEHRKLLDTQQQMEQFNSDLLHIYNSLDELSQKLSKVKGQLGEDLASAKSRSLAFHHFEETVKLLEERIDTFMSTDENCLKSKHSSSIHVQQELVSLRSRWDLLYQQVIETRQLINLSIEYFTLVDEAESWFRDGGQLLMAIANKSSLIKTPEEANELLHKIDLFLKPGETKQDERIHKISEIAIQLYGDIHPEQLHHVKNESQEIIASFSQVSLELQQILNFLNKSPEEQKVEIIGLQEARPIEEKQTSKSPSPPPKKVKVEPEPQPPNFTLPLHDAIIDEGSRFTFECRVSGIPMPEICWLKDNISIDSNLDYRTVVEGDGLCSLTIEETFIEDSACFTCRATNLLGYAETTALLTVKENERETLPMFVKHLSAISSKEESACSMTCKVEGIPLPTVQWFKDGVCVDTSENYSTTYNNGDAILTVNKLQLADQGQYCCQATNRVGTAVTSASLTVEPIVSEKAPIFVNPLSNVMARAGQKIKFEAEISGTPEPELEWSHNGKSLPDSRDFKFHSEKGKALMIIPEAFPKDAGTYTLSARNRGGCVISSCFVTIKGRLPNETSDSELASDVEPIKPSMPNQLKDTVVLEGEKAQFDCVIVGQPEPEVIWYHENVPIKESKEVQLLFQGDRCSLIIAETLLEDAGEYKVIAINSAGEASSTCRLIVQKSRLNQVPQTTEPNIQNTKPQFISLLTDVLGTEGDCVTLECAVLGNPTPTVSWLLNNNPLLVCDRFKMVQESDGICTLQINPVVIEDKGVYTAKATNCCGEVKCFAHLIVKSAANISNTTNDIEIVDQKTIPFFIELFGDKTVVNGSETKFECVVNGKPTPKVKWLFNNEQVSGKEFLPSVSGSKQVLTIPAVSQKLSGGSIVCVAENEAGKASCSASITVIEAPPVSDLLLPIDQLNLTETTAFEMKREVFMETRSHQQFGKGDPIQEVHGIATKTEQTTQMIENKPTIQVELHQGSEYHNVDGLENKLDRKSQSITSSNSETKIPGKVVSQRKQIPPRFVCPITGKIVDQGTDVCFESTVEGFPVPTVVWERNGKPIIESNRCSISWYLNKAVCMVKCVTIDDTGKYSCIATNPVGTASCTADLLVKKNVFPPVFGKRLLTETLVVGKRAVLEVEVTGTPDPVITWFKDGNQIASSSSMFRVLHQGNSHKLIIDQAGHSHSGLYEVRAVNSGGEARCCADLLIIEGADTTRDLDFSKQQDSLLQNHLDSCTETFESNTKISIVVKKSENPFSSAIDSPLIVNPCENKTHYHPSFVPQNDNNLPIRMLDEQCQEQLDSVVEVTSISKKSALNFFQDIIKENQDNAKAMQPLTSNYEYRFSESFPEQTSPHILQDSLHKSEGICSIEGTILYPEPPPEIGFICKSQVTNTKDGMADKVKRLEEAHRVLPQEQIPSGGVRIFPTSKEEVTLESVTKKQTQTSLYKHNVISDEDSTIQQTSQTRIDCFTNDAFSEDLVQKNNEYYEQFESPTPGFTQLSHIHTEHQSRQPSAEGKIITFSTSEEKGENILIPHVLPTIELMPPIQQFSNNITASSMSNSSLSFNEFKPTVSQFSLTTGLRMDNLETPTLNQQTNISNISTGERPISPSIEGLAMDKLWGHKSSTQRKIWPPPQSSNDNQPSPPWKNNSTKDNLAQHVIEGCNNSFNSKTISPEKNNLESFKSVSCLTSNSSERETGKIDHGFKDVSVKEKSMHSYIPSPPASKIIYHAEAYTSHSTNIPSIQDLSFKSDTQIKTCSEQTESIEERSSSNIMEENGQQRLHAVKTCSFSNDDSLFNSLKFGKESTNSSRVVNDIPLVPGPPPEIGFAKPPQRRPSYIETIEQDLEKNLEKSPTKHIAGAVRIIPPAPKKENSSINLTHKRTCNMDDTVNKKTAYEPESVKKPLPKLEPFPFKPDPPKEKPRKCPPPPKPSKFVKGSFTESDYESDFESAKIAVKWNPWQSDSEDYNKVRPQNMHPVKIPHSAMGQTVSKPEFEKPGLLKTGSKYKIPQQIELPTIIKHKVEKSDETLHKHISSMAICSDKNKAVFHKLESPPEYIDVNLNTNKPNINKPNSPKSKHKCTQSFFPESGYMADTDEPTQHDKVTKFEENIKSQKGEQAMFFETSKTDMKMSSSHINQTTIKKESTTIGTKLVKEFTPPELSATKPWSPSKEHIGLTSTSLINLTKGECDSENEFDVTKNLNCHSLESAEDFAFRPVRPILTPINGRSQNLTRTPTPPTEFDDPPTFIGPPRPKFEPIAKSKTHNKVNDRVVDQTKVIRPKPIQVYSSPHLETIYAKPASKPALDFILKPGSPPKMDYAPPPGFVEKSNIMNYTESTEKCKRVVNVQQTTRVMQFGGSTFNQVKENMHPTKFGSAFPYTSEYEKHKDGTPSKHVQTPYIEAEKKRLKRVAEMKKRFLETEPFLQPGEPPEFAYIPETSKVSYSAAATQMNEMTKMFKGKTQELVSNLLTDINTSQSNCKDKVNISNDDVDKPETYREESRLSEHGKKHIDPDTGLIYFKYDFGYEFGIVLPGDKNVGIDKKTNISTPEMKQEGTIDIPVIHETQKQNKTKMKKVKWEPTSESEMSEIENERIQRGTLSLNFYTRSPHSPASSGKSISPYPVLGHDNAGNMRGLAEDSNIIKANPLTADQPKKSPLFIAPLRDIACKIGQPARFECIVLAEPSPSVIWAKDGVSLHYSSKYQIEYRNGVCRLFLPKIGQSDVGQYTCSASNSVGCAETTANLHVPGERRSLF